MALGVIVPISTRERERCRVPYGNKGKEERKFLLG